MNKYKFEEILVNLKVLSQTPRNRKLRMTSNGYFTLEDNNILVPLKRLLFGENREKLVRDLNYLFSGVGALVKLLLSSKFIDEKDTDESRKVLSQIAAIHRELENCLIGFENLKATYEPDKLMVGELEVMMDKVRAQIADIELKLPNVAENIPPILVENQ
jgi:hypothetical protein